MDWDNLKVFLAVERSRSLTEAAAQIKVSQPTVGRRLTALEETLGVMLFDRRPDGWRLTAAGKKLKPLAIEVEARISALERATDRLTDDDGGLVRVTGVWSVCRFILDRVRAANLAGRAISVELIHDGSLYSLAKREADIAVRIRRSAPRGDLVTRSLGVMAFALYGSPQTAALPADQLAFVGFDLSSQGFRQSQWLDAFADGRPVVMRASSVDLRMRAALMGMGATILPCFLGDAQPGLVRLTPPIPELTEELQLLVHGDVAGVNRMRVMTDFLFGTFKLERARLSGVASGFDMDVAPMSLPNGDEKLSEI